MELTQLAAALTAARQEYAYRNGIGSYTDALGAMRLRHLIRAALEKRMALLAGPQHADTLAQSIAVALIAEMPSLLENINGNS